MHEQHTIGDDVWNFDLESLTDRENDYATGCSIYPVIYFEMSYVNAVIFDVLKNGLKSMNCHCLLISKSMNEILKKKKMLIIFF